MTIPDHAESKRILRARMRATPVDISRHNPRIRELVARWLEEHSSYHHIALYHPLPDEPDLLPLLPHFPGRIWYFPRIADGVMTFHAISSLSADLTRNDSNFGIPAPRPSIPATAPADIDVFLCPGLAFEIDTGFRLGRGKGFYDRTLSQARPNSPRIGITFPERLVPHTFAEPHDIRMHQVLS